MIGWLTNLDGPALVAVWLSVVSTALAVPLIVIFSLTIASPPECGGRAVGGHADTPLGLLGFAVVLGAIAAGIVATRRGRPAGWVTIGYNVGLVVLCLVLLVYAFRATRLEFC